MLSKLLIAWVLVMAAAPLAQAGSVAERLDRAIAGDHRAEANRARDVYRHPKETLLFFGLKPDLTVVEIWPSAGWYTDILAPVLRDGGKLYAARFAVSWDKAPDWAKERDKAFLARMAGRPDIFDQVVPTEILDMVLTFRNVHNWAKAGTADAMFAIFLDLLKSGGVLGVEEHRAKPGTSFDEQVRTGYMTEQYVIETAELAGFRFVGRSEINANPKDTKDYPDGVWTLPPTLRLGDKDRDRYLAIGESDRMTLKFVKP
jgi:predicted methyltransferase